MEEENKITKLQLQSTHPEAGNVRTFVFNTGGLSWVAGQNQGYRLKQAGETTEENERWFTISSAPSEGTINISTRISESAFKQALNALNPGDEIECYELGGDFTWEEESSEPVVLVAGGIGITPFRSILIERASQGKKLNATLLYFNRNDEIPFEEELDELAEKHSEFRLRKIIGERITAQKIMEMDDRARDRLVYVSGPKEMVKSISAELEQEGVRVKQDRFPGYDETNF